jgi:hypothetical protein
VCLDAQPSEIEDDYKNTYKITAEQLCAFDRDLRPYTREGNMISERKYIYPEALDFSWIMA